MRPIRGKSKKHLARYIGVILAKSDFCPYRAEHPSSPTQGAAPKVACRWAMDSLPLRGASHSAWTTHYSLFHKAPLTRSLAIGLWTLSLSGNIRVTTRQRKARVTGGTDARPYVRTCQVRWRETNLCTHFISEVKGRLEEAKANSPGLVAPLGRPS